MQGEVTAHFIEMTLSECRLGKTQADRAVAQTDDRAFFARLDEEAARLKAHGLSERGDRIKRDDRSVMTTDV
jgi:hypothetical protein